MTEYAYISIDADGIEYISKTREVDADKRAELPAKKRADIRPVERRDATFDPATQRLGPEVVTVMKTKVRIERQAVDMDASEQRARALRQRQTAYREAGLTPDAMTAAVFRADTDPAELARLRALRDTIDSEHPLP